MNIVEYGTEHKDTIILLHGGGLSWWNYRESAMLLQNEYHIVLPILDGHAGSDRPFTTIEENAAEIISFIDVHLCGHVLLIGGLSLGGQILLELLSQRGDICSHALVESAAVIPSKLTNALIAPAFGSSYGLISNRSFARLQFQSLHMKPELFEDYYRDTCLIKKQDMIAFMKANTSYALKDAFRETAADVHVYVGEKETGEILRSAEAICRMRPSCILHRMKGLRHGEFSINHADQYAEAIRRIIHGE
ncbi:MAG: alpha/beta hydrolase [Solobacterium sp.]|nr:alpha/beta hydrolase [Solobacterium sp.]